MPKLYPDESLFENTRMTFGEHLEELRRTLIRALLGLGVGCLIGFYVADPLVNFLQGPLTVALEEFSIAQSKQEIEQRLGYVPPEYEIATSQHGLAPRTVFVDPGQLVSALRAASPTALADVPVSPYRFQPDEILPHRTRHLANKLSGIAPLTNERDEQAERQRARYRAVANYLSAEQAQRISGWANAPDPPPSDEVAEILNSLVDQPALHDDPAFADWVGPTEHRFLGIFPSTSPNPLHVMKLEADRTANVDMGRRINRLLLRRLFAEDLSQASLDTIPLEIWEPVRVRIQSLQPQEAFMIWLKAGIFAGLIISAPWLFYQIWSFVASGLYPHEKHYVHIYLPISIALFLGGVVLAFFFVMRPVLNFLFMFNAGMGINPQPRIGDWLSFVMFLPLGFGIAFQLPIVMLFLHRLGLFSVADYLSKWRIAVMVIAVLSMIITPADPVSMVMLLIPLSILYFGGIGLCRWMPRPSSPYGPATEP